MQKKSDLLKPTPPDNSTVLITKSGNGYEIWINDWFSMQCLAVTKRELELIMVEGKRLLDMK